MSRISPSAPASLPIPTGPVPPNGESTDNALSINPTAPSGQVDAFEPASGEPDGGGAKVGEPDGGEGDKPDPDSPWFVTGQREGDFAQMDPTVEAHELQVASQEIQAVQSGKATLGPKLTPFGNAAKFVMGSPTTDPTLQTTSYNSGRPRQIIEDPQHPGTFFVAGSNSGVEKTVNGKGWQYLMDNAPSLSTGAMALDPKNPSTMYVGLGDPFSTAMPGFIKSVDGGKTWSQPILLSATYPGDAKPVTASATRDLKVSPDDPNVLLAATNVGLFRSTDGGKSFSLVVIPSDQPVPPGQKGPNSSHKSFWSLEHTGKNSWVAATRDYDRKTPEGFTLGSIWHSEDNGATWTRSTLPKLSGDAGRITLKASEGTVGSANPVVYAVVGAADGQSTVGFLASHDGGKTWTEPSPFNKNGQPENPTQDQPDLDVFHDQAFYNQALLVDPKNPNNIAVGGNKAMVSSNDGGQTWRVESDWAPPYSGMAPRTYAHADMHGGLITYDAQGKMKVLVMTDGGIDTTDDKLFTGAPGEAKWSSSWNKDRHDSLVQAIAWDGKGPVLAGLQDNGVVLTNSSSNEATQVGGGDGFGAAIGNGGQFMIHSHNGYLFRSSDAGKTWDVAMNGLPETGPFDVRVRALPEDASGKSFVTIRQTEVKGPDGKPALGPGGVFETTDGGASWSALPAQVTRRDGSTVQGIPGTVRDIEVSRTTPNLWAVVTDEGFVYVTRDAGKTFSESTQVAGKGTALPTENINSVEFDPADPSGNSYYVASATGWGQYTDVPGIRPTYVYKTTDGGSTWKPITGTAAAPLPNVQVNELRADPTNPKHLVAATVIGLYRSEDGGDTWQRFDMPYVDTTGVVLSQDGKTLVAGTYGRDYLKGSA